MGQLVLAENASNIEKLFFGAKIAVMGIGTVFAILLILWLVLMVFQLVFDKSKVGAKAPAPKKNTEPVTVPAVQQTNDEDDTELIAVLMAAICAANGNCDPSKLRIVSYKRQKTPWNRK